MAIDQRKRQLKLVKQKAKRKKGSSVRNRFADPWKKMISAYEVMFASKSPVYECWVPTSVVEMGMGNVVFSRKAASGAIYVSFFLLDMLCLGVKDAHFASVTEAEYQRILRKLRGKEALEKVSPAYLRKLVEDSEKYAMDLGFIPHSDYQSAKNIFGDVDKTECDTEFVFGKDGKPTYYAGPNDSPKRVEMILNTLERNCGPDEYDFVVPADMMPDTIKGNFQIIDLESDEDDEDEDE